MEAWGKEVLSRVAPGPSIFEYWQQSWKPTPSRAVQLNVQGKFIPYTTVGLDYLEYAIAIDDDIGAVEKALGSRFNFYQEFDLNRRWLLRVIISGSFDALMKGTEFFLSWTTKVHQGLRITMSNFWYDNGGGSDGVLSATTANSALLHLQPMSVSTTDNQWSDMEVMVNEETCRVSNVRSIGYLGVLLTFLRLRAFREWCLMRSRMRLSAWKSSRSAFWRELAMSQKFWDIQIWLGSVRQTRTRMMKGRNGGRREYVFDGRGCDEWPACCWLYEYIMDIETHQVDGKKIKKISIFINLPSF